MRDSAITPLPLTPPQLPPTVPVRGLDPLSLHTADTKDPHKVRDLLVGHGLLEKTATGGYDSTVESTVIEKVGAVLEEVVPEIQQGIEQGVNEKLKGYSTIEDTDTKLEKKVSKEAGKGLSSNDYTTEEKTKLAGIEKGAQKNPNLSPYAKTYDVNIALESKVSRSEDNTETMGRAITVPTDFTSQVTFTTDRPRMNNRGAFYADSSDFIGKEYHITASTTISVIDEYGTPTGETLELGEIFTDGALQAIGSALGSMDPSYGMYFEPGQINISLGQPEFSVMLWDNETSDYTKEWSRKVTAETAYATTIEVVDGLNHYSINIPLYTSDTHEYFGDLYMVDLAYSYGVENTGVLGGVINLYGGVIDTSSIGFTDPELEEAYYDIKLSTPEEIQFCASVDPDPYDPYMGHISPVNMGTFRTDMDGIDASEIKSGELDLARLPTIPAEKMSGLPASKITSGTFSADRIPNLPASKITSGSFPYSVLPQEIKVKRRTFADTAGILLASNVVGTFVDGGTPTRMAPRWYIAGLTHGGRATILVSRASYETMAGMIITVSTFRPTLRNLLRPGNATIHFVGDPVTLDTDPMPAGVYEIFGFGNSTSITPPAPTYDMDLTGYEFIIRFTALPLE